MHGNPTNHMRTGQTAYQRMVTFIHRTYLSGGVVRSFEHVQNLPTDRTGQNGYHLTRNAFTAWGTDKKRMQTDMNRQRILLSVTGLLVLSGKVWQSPKNTHLLNGHML